MKVVLETGQGISCANSYIQEGDVKTFLPSTNRGDWNKLSQDEKNDHLVIATRFIDSSFNWIGRATTTEQALAWPRSNVLRGSGFIPCDVIPRQVKQACVLAIEKMLTNGIAVFQSDGSAAIKREKFAVMQTEYFAPNKSVAGFESDYTDINNLLRGLYVRANGKGLTAEVLRV